MLIINARVRTMAEKDYEKGYVQICGDKITAVGDMTDCPHDAEGSFDAQGGWLLPGLIDSHCHIGMWEDGLGFEGDDGNEDTDPSTPHLRALDAINPFDRAFSEAIDYGVTTVVTGPGSANPIAGQMCAIKTDGRRVDDMVVCAPLAIKMAMGENPKSTYHQKDSGPTTRMAIAAIMREQFAKAKKYQKQLADAQRDEELDEPEYDAKCEALLPLLEGRIKAHIHAHRADDIFTAIRIAKEFEFSYVIVHGTAAHLIAQELAEEGASVICGPLIGARTKPELAAMSLSGAAQLHQAGVQIAICSDHPEIPCDYLLMSAQLAAENGLEEQVALKAITIQPARICNLEKRIGSLEVGKDADLVLFMEDPMKTRKKAAAVFINGKKVR